jgi:hypothetical protein
MSGARRQSTALLLVSTALCEVIPSLRSGSRYRHPAMKK